MSKPDGVKKSRGKKASPLLNLALVAYAALFISSFVFHGELIRLLAWCANGSSYRLVFTLMGAAIATGVLLTLSYGRSWPAWLRYGLIAGAALQVFVVFSFIPGKTNTSSVVRGWDREFADAGLVNGGTIMNGLFLATFGLMVVLGGALSLKTPLLRRLSVLGAVTAWVLVGAYIAHANHEEVLYPPGPPYTEVIYDLINDPAPDTYGQGGDYEDVRLPRHEFSRSCTALASDVLVSFAPPVTCESAILLDATGLRTENRARCLMLYFSEELSEEQIITLDEARFVNVNAYDYFIRREVFKTGYAYCAERGPLVDGLPPVSRTLLTLPLAIEMGLI